MLFIKSLVFNLSFYLWTFLCGLLIVPLFFFPRGLTVKVSQKWAAGSMILARFLIGLRYEIRGWSFLPKKGSFIVACKHQSAWETIVFSCLFDDPALVLKNSLSKIPLYGQFLRKLGMIPVERGSARQSFFLSQAQQAVDLGRPLVIFPEGTRRNIGEKTIYYGGAFILAKHFNLPVVPAALNSGVFWPRRKITKKPGKIILEFCPPLTVTSDRQIFMRHLQEITEAKSHQLVQES